MIAFSSLLRGHAFKGLHNLLKKSGSKRALMPVLAACLALGSALLPQEVLAGWYTASGRAAVHDNDVETARRAAVDDAVRNALLEAGANISIYQDFKDGTLLSERMEIGSNFPVKRITVIEEQRTLNAVQVRARIYIDDDNLTRCPLSAVKKAVLPVTFRFEDNLTYGGAAGLEDLTVELSDMIFSKLGASDAILLSPEMNMNFLRGVRSALSYDEIRNLEALSRKENVQYVLTGVIRSLSLSDAGPSVIDKLFYAKTRRIDFTVSLYDAIKGEVVLSRDYSAETDWDFKQGEHVDVRSERFLSSSYGQRVSELAAYAVEDVLTSLQCTAPSARVMQSRGDNLLINIGESSGVAKGQTFTLVHFAEFTDRQGRFFQTPQRSNARYKVIEVYPHSALIAPSGGSQLMNVSPDDLVTLY